MSQSIGAATLKRARRHDIARSKANRFLSTVQRADRLRGLDVKEFCDVYGVNQDTFTRLTGFSPRAVAHWAQGRRPSASTERRLAELSRLFEELEKFIARENIGPWLKEPNPAFESALAPLGGCHPSVRSIGSSSPARFPYHLAKTIVLARW